MTIEFTEFVGKAPVLQAIRVTAENVEELATWLGADAYSVQKVLVGGARKVEFQEIRDEPRYPYPRAVRLIEVEIGNYIVKVPKMISESMRPLDERYFEITPEQLADFIAQRERGDEIDFSAAPYDR